MTKRPLAELESCLGYKFADQSLLQQSLTHASFSGPTASYERLEFLGDRVLGLLLAHYFYEHCPDDNEGALSLRLHSEARTATLAMVARKLNIAYFLQAQPGMSFAENDNVLADVIESLLAAIYLDSGLKDAAAFLKAHWPLASTTPASREKDAKSRLQEWALGQGLGLPVYRQLAKSGPDHAPEMTYEVSVANAGSKSATGSNRKIAEQKAAAALLARLQAGDEM
ncbi:MAG: ribonuclease III [Proteobacteria bacterium]|nr:ribonuclease III [Pseudomonadota bacterium]MDA0845218.1 ribonuclease III [Pseudomonadota bacterium]